MICVTAKGKPIKAKTVGQKRLCGCHQEKHHHPGRRPRRHRQDLSGCGRRPWPPSGTRQVNRIILTRPAVEAGERLGFLPGDLQSKVDPYLRPLYDALFDMLGAETYQKYLERGNIEVAPLAYMRGRTLDDSFIILDEAQNTSREQMKMFLTRLGFGSKIVITGDITQIDLPRDTASGLKEAMRVLQGCGGHRHLPPDERRMWCATCWFSGSSPPMSGTRAAVRKKRRSMEGEKHESRDPDRVRVGGGVSLPGAAGEGHLRRAGRRGCADKL